MKKSEIISSVLSAVSEETEITREEILSQSKRREIVDARHIAIYLLAQYGIYQSNIAEAFKTTPRNVQYIIADFDTRLLFSPPMKADYERIAKHLSDNPELGRKQLLFRAIHMK